jgi:hypothetical protein
LNSLKVFFLPAKLPYIFIPGAMDTIFMARRISKAKTNPSKNAGTALIPLHGTFGFSFLGRPGFPGILGTGGRPGTPFLSQPAMTKRASSSVFFPVLRAVLRGPLELPIPRKKCRYGYVHNTGARLTSSKTSFLIGFLIVIG